MEAACRAPDPGSMSGVYKPRRPADTLLYRVVRENLETFLASSREACPDDDPIPGYVERTFRKYLECGILAHGFARAFCDRCRHEFLVAFSCKTRGLCPSCDTRRMVETAAHLVDHVLPRAPVRQWVLSVPKRVRYFLQRDRKISSGVLRIFLGEVERALRRCSPGAPARARFGAAAFLQRFGSALNEHPHHHVVATDGVFGVGAGGEAEFFEASGLTVEDIETVEERVRGRVLRYLERQGCLDAGAVEGMLSWDHAGGFSVDGSVRIEGWDRQGLERVVRYCARPPFASMRLGAVDGKIVYELAKPMVDGRTLLVLDPLQFLSRLAKLIPPPRAHQVRYFGVLAPHSKLREQVAATAGPGPEILERMKEAAAKMGLEVKLGGGEAAAAAGAGPKDDAQEKEPKRRASRMWAMLIARIFESLPLLCTRCGAPMRILAFITGPEAVGRILEHLGEPTKPPPILPARGPPQGEFEVKPA